MDLNKLYFDHQISLMQAARSPTGERRRDHQHSASRIADRIGSLQRDLGATAARGWELAAAPDWPDGLPLAAVCGRWQ